MSKKKELWSVRWVAYPTACLFPRQKREEWMGDLHEVILKMADNGYPKCVINIICIAWTLILIASAIEISIKDLLIAAKKIN